MLEERTIETYFMKGDEKAQVERGNAQFNQSRDGLCGHGRGVFCWGRGQLIFFNCSYPITSGKWEISDQKNDQNPHINDHFWFGDRGG